MIHQLSLDEAVHATTAAVALVEVGAGDAWMDEALACIARVAEGQAELTVNDVWEAGLSEPKCPRAIGAAMRKARRANLIVSTDRRAPSLQTHMSRVLVWKSLVYGGLR